MRQLQSLNLQPQQDTTAWESGPGLHTSAIDQPHSQHDPNQYSAYDPERDSTAQATSPWQGQEYSYYDPYSHSGYGGYYDQGTYDWGAYESELGDDWDQLGFAAEPDPHDHGAQSQQHSVKAETARRMPSEQQLCSQFQVSGKCPRGSSCHMAHGALCEVCLLCSQAVAVVLGLNGVMCGACCCQSWTVVCVASSSPDLHTHLLAACWFHKHICLLKQALTSKSRTLT